MTKALEPTRRISPLEVLDAYRLTGITPGNSCRNCGLAALMKLENKIDGHNGGWLPAQEEWIDREIGEVYKEGFCNGFDVIVLTPQDVPRKGRELAGFNDGQAAREAVFGK